MGLSYNDPRMVSILDRYVWKDLLPPALAAWTANIVFAGLGTALFLNART